MARNNSEDVPIEAKIDESMFDVSLNSVKSDARVRTWCSSVEYIVSLRIAAKELVYQTKVWQKKELVNQKRDLELPQDSDFFKSLSLLRTYLFQQKQTCPLIKYADHVLRVAFRLLHFFLIIYP